MSFASNNGNVSFGLSLFANQIVFLIINWFIPIFRIFFQNIIKQLKFLEGYRVFVLFLLAITFNSCIPINYSFHNKRLIWSFRDFFVYFWRFFLSNASIGQITLSYWHFSFVVWHHEWFFTALPHWLVIKVWCVTCIFWLNLNKSIWFIDFYFGTYVALNIIYTIRIFRKEAFTTLNSSMKWFQLCLRCLSKWVDTIEMDNISESNKFFGININSSQSSSCLASAQIYLYFGILCNLQMVSNSILSPTFIVLKNIILLIIICLFTNNKPIIHLFIHHCVFDAFLVYKDLFGFLFFRTLFEILNIFFAIELWKFWFLNFFIMCVTFFLSLLNLWLFIMLKVVCINVMKIKFEISL